MAQNKKIKIFTALILLIAVIGGIYFNKTTNNSDIDKSKLENPKIKTKIIKKYKIIEKDGGYTIENTELPLFKNIRETELNNIFVCSTDSSYSLLFFNNEDNSFKLIDGIRGMNKIKNNKAIIIMKEKVGLVGLDGTIILPDTYEEIYLGENNTIIYKETTKYFRGYIKNNKTEKIKELKVETLHKLDDKKLVYIKSGLMGIMAFNGKTIIPNKYNEISSFVDEIFIGEKKGKYSLYNLKNKKVSEDYDYIEQIDNDYYRGGTEDIGKYAFIGEGVVTEEKYDEITKVNGIKSSYYLGKSKETLDVFNNKGKFIKTVKVSEEKDFNVNEIISEIEKSTEK